MVDAKFADTRFSEIVAEFDVLLYRLQELHLRAVDRVLESVRAARVPCLCGCPSSAHTRLKKEVIIDDIRYRIYGCSRCPACAIFSRRRFKLGEVDERSGPRRWNEGRWSGQKKPVRE